MNLIHLHRVSFYLYKHHLRFFSKPFELIIFLIYNSRVPCSVKIGRKSKFAYLGIGCVLHKNCVIGTNCLIGQGITIGGRGPHIGVPIIGNNVYLGPGSRVLGPINVGDNVIIGANSVVINDIPSGSVVVGVPGRVVKSGVDDISKYL